MSEGSRLMLAQIRNLRLELIKLADDGHLQKPEVLELSQRIDDLIVEYTKRFLMEPAV